MRGQVITFYSYKGGTGRSMALANTACLLAKSLPPDEAVLAVDWDLEAPGLHHFFQRPDGVDSRPGVIDLVLDLQSLLDKDESLRKDSDAVADLIASFDFDRFIVPTKVPNVRFMAAGTFDDDYESRVVSFDWPSFYEKAPSALLALADFLGTRYRYVLIDSRPGLSDLTGVCAMILPEKLVTVFTPSRQSLDGLEGVIRRALDYRRQSPDLRPLGVFPLPSRIELAEPDLKAAWRLGDNQGVGGYQPLFERLFRELYEIPECSLQDYFDDVQIQHVPKYAYGEQIAVLVEKEADRLSLTRSYQAFTSRVEHLAVPWDTPDTEELVTQHVVDDEAERSYLQAADLFEEVGDIRGQSRTLVNLARHQLRRGMKDAADGTILKAMSLVRILDDESEAELLLELGDLVLPADPARAITMYDRACQTAQRELTAGDAFRKRGDALFMLSQFPPALANYNKAVAAYHNNSDNLEEAQRRRADMQPRLAKANLEAGRYETATELYSKLLQLASASGDDLAAADVLVDLASAHLGMRSVDVASEEAVRALEICERLRHSNPGLWLVRARIAAAKGDFDQAGALVDQAIQEYRKAGDKRGIASALRYAGDFRANRKQVKIS